MPHQPESRRLPNSTPSASGRTIFGHAAKFGVRSRPMVLNGAEFVEVLMPGCFPDLNNQDVKAFFNHNAGIVLARSKYGKGTLSLSVDNIGLRYSFEAPNSSVGNDLLESIKRGDIDAASFAFTVAPGGDSFSTENGKRIRRIRKIETLHDISIVTDPAYLDATVAARANSSSRDAAEAEIADWAARLGLK